MVAYEIFQFTQDQVPDLSSPSLPQCKKIGSAGRPTGTRSVLSDNLFVSKVTGGL